MSDYDDNVGVGIIQTDMSWRVVRANRIADLLMGISTSRQHVQLDELTWRGDSFENLRFELEDKGNVVGIPMRLKSVDMSFLVYGCHEPTPPECYQLIFIPIRPVSLWTDKTQVPASIEPLLDACYLGFHVETPDGVVLFCNRHFDPDLSHPNPQYVEKQSTVKEGVERVSVRLPDGMTYEVFSGRVKTLTGSERIVRLALDITPLWDAYRTIKEQADQLSKLNEEIRELAERDGLTSIYNRRYFESRLRDEVERSKRYGSELSFIYFDIDNFKEFNDAHGHPSGDDVLKSLTDVVKSRLRRTDIFCRYGGEEFVILLPETSLRRAVVLARGLKRTVASHQFPNRQVTISVGVAMLESREGARAFLERVDRAMYKAKRSGRNKLYVAYGDDLVEE